MSDTIIDQYVYPTHHVGETIPGAGRVIRVERTSAGSQTVWTGRCPAWCTGHVPAGQASSPEEAAAYEWDVHFGTEQIVALADLSSQGEVYREGRSGVHAYPAMIGRQVPTIALDGLGDTAALTAPEARSVAAMLIKVADELEA